MKNEYYKTRNARLDTVVGDDAAYWAMLGRILLDAKNADTPMQHWCEQEHGFRMVYDDLRIYVASDRELNFFQLRWPNPIL